MGPHTPCTPHTPGLPATPLTPGTGHKSPRSGLNRYALAGYKAINMLLLIAIFQCWEKQRLHGQYQKRLLSGGSQLRPRCHHRRGHRRLGRKLSFLQKISYSFKAYCCDIWNTNIFLQQLNNMDPGDLLSFLDGPGDLATPPSSGRDHDQTRNDCRRCQFSNETNPQVRDRRRGSREGTPLRTTSSLSSTERAADHLSLDLPICAVRASSQWPPLCVLLRRGSLPLVLYYASHLGPNLGPRIWGPWTRGPIAQSNSGPSDPWCF